MFRLIKTMSAIILRIGLWALVALIVTYVLKDTAGDSAIAGAIGDNLLFLLIQIALGVVALGIVVRLVERAGFEGKNRCGVCRRKIPAKTLYCRDHLNEVVEEEDLRHRTMNTRLPD